MTSLMGLTRQDLHRRSTGASDGAVPRGGLALPARPNSVEGTALPLPSLTRVLGVHAQPTPFVSSQYRARWTRGWQEEASRAAEAPG